MEEPFLTIIIPVYNAATTIRQTLESCFNQTKPHFEIIVINDGSSDNTKSILSELANDHPNLHIYHQPNSGVAAARNLGIEKCTTDWISFLDADDSIEETFVQQCANILASHQQIEGIIFQHHTVNGNDKKAVVKNEKEGVVNVSPFELTETYPTVWAKLFKRSIIIQKSITYYPACTLEDVFFTLEYFLQTKQAYISSACLYNYQYNDSSLSRKISLQTIDQREGIVSAYYEKLVTAFKNQPHFANFFLTRLLKQVFLSTGQTMREEDKKVAFKRSIEYCNIMLDKMRVDFLLANKPKLLKLIAAPKIKLAFLFVMLLFKLPVGVAFNIMKLTK